MSNNTHDKFPGFPDSLQKASWQFPSIINGFVHTLNGAEFKVLWYILRHTFGWQKTSDKISISQICKGIQRKDGIWIDKGTGLSRKWIMKSLTALEERGFISVLKESGKVSRISVNIVNNEDTGVESTLVPVEQSTPVTGVESTPTITNSTITNTNNDDNAPQYFSNKKTNPLIISKGQQISYLKAFPTLSSTELKIEIGRCNNYMGMSSQVYSNPGLFLKKWLTRYMAERGQKRANEKKLFDEQKAMQGLPEEQRLKNIKKLNEIRGLLKEKLFI